MLTRFHLLLTGNFFPCSAILMVTYYYSPKVACVLYGRRKFKRKIKVLNLNCSSLCTSDSVGSSDGSNSCETQPSNLPAELDPEKASLFSPPSTSKLCDKKEEWGKSKITSKTEGSGIEPVRKQDVYSPVNFESVRNSKRSHCNEENDHKAEVSNSLFFAKNTDISEGPNGKKKKPQPLDLNVNETAQIPSIHFGLTANPLLATSPILSPLGFLAASLSANQLIASSPQSALWSPSGRCPLLGTINTSLTTPVGSPTVNPHPFFQFPPSPQQAALMAQQMTAAISPLLPLPHSLLMDLPKR